MRRYRDADKPPPLVLYTDRECCGSEEGGSKYNSLFSEWKDLQVRLDIYHILRRFALGVTSEAHPLYGTLVRRLTSCMFEWDPEDLCLLEKSKKAEMSKPAFKIPQP